MDKFIYEPLSQAGYFYDLLEIMDDKEILKEIDYIESLEDVA